MKACRKYAELNAQKRELMAELAKVKKEMSEIEESATDEMLNSGMARVPIAGELLFFSELVFVSPKTELDMTDLKCTFDDLGIGDLISEKLNIRGLAAHLREVITSGDTVPEILRESFDIEVVSKLRARSDPSSIKRTDTLSAYLKRGLASDEE